MIIIISDVFCLILMNSSFKYNIYFDEFGDGISLVVLAECSLAPFLATMRRRVKTHSHT